MIKPSNHLDIEGIDALIEALKLYKGGVISISHDERFITNTANQVSGGILSREIMTDD